MSRGGSRGFHSGGRGGTRGFQQRDFGPPETILEMGTFLHAVEDEMLCSSLMVDKVPYFNAPIYLQNKSVIGKIDEILGPINQVFFSVKMGDGIVANSFKKGDKVYIGADKLLPIERFLPKPKITGGVSKRTRGRGGPGARGAPRRGGFQQGGIRGASRGSFGGQRGGRGTRSRGFGDGRGGRGQRGGMGRGGFRRH
jgi:H/ACA ribonucleoprotein complex subunit 1